MHYIPVDSALSSWLLFQLWTQPALWIHQQHSPGHLKDGTERSGTWGFHWGAQRASGYCEHGGGRKALAKYKGFRTLPKNSDTGFAQSPLWICPQPCTQMKKCLKYFLLGFVHCNLPEKNRNNSDLFPTTQICPVCPVNELGGTKKISSI